MISDIKDLREEKNDSIFDLKVDVSTSGKKANSLCVELNNINHYEHRDWLVISRDIIPHGTSTENCNDSLFILVTFKHELR